MASAAPTWAAADAGQRVRLLVRAVPDRAPVITRLAEQGVVVQAINYKDRPEDAKAWLAELGDPFRAHRRRPRPGGSGSTGASTACPETYVIDKDGRIAYRHVGPLQARDLDRTILPLLEQLK